MIRWTAWPLLVAALVGLGCNGDSNPFGTPDDPDDGGALTDGTFRATISGAASATFTGTAYFASTSEAFTMTLSGVGDPVGGIGLTRLGVGRPLTGAHSVRAVSSQNLWGSGYVGSTANSFVSSSGTLDVNSSSTTLLVGTVQFQANGNFSGIPGTVTVTATFRATCAAVSLVCD
jgi:hypothetical protein